MRCRWDSLARCCSRLVVGFIHLRQQLNYHRPAGLYHLKLGHNAAEG